MQLKMEKVSITTETMAANQEREHVVFSITARQIKEHGADEGPPTFIAQTRKHGEQQILKEVYKQYYIISYSIAFFQCDVDLEVRYSNTHAQEILFFEYRTTYIIFSCFIIGRRSSATQT